jgi:hypothetical protein
MTNRGEFKRRVAEMVAAGVPEDEARESVSRELQYEGDLLPPRRTGLVCPACRQPAAQVEHQTPTAMTFVCQACGHRWSAERPGTKPH